MLVVSQKTKLIELTNEYAVYDGQGEQIGAVGQMRSKNGVNRSMT